MREIRFSLLPDQQPGINSWAGSPPARQLAPFVTLRAVVEGPVQKRTGYVCNIKLIDKLLRQRAVGAILRQVSQGVVAHESMALAAWRAVVEEPPSGTIIRSLALLATPYLTFYIESESPQMISVTQSFEFSAAHRLYCSDLTPEQNWEIFGKCTNPNGHGHNYVVDVTVRIPAGGDPLPLHRFEETVVRRVIDRFDHKHLNADCPEFAAINPSVENITKAVWSLLIDQLAPGTLHAVRVWETPKTYAEYRGEG